LVDLVPGAYKDLHLSGHTAALNLSGGVYTFKKANISSGVTVNLDTSLADVVLNVHKGFKTGHGVSFVNSGGGNVVLNVFDDNVWLGHDNAIEADVRVWDGNFGADKGLDLAGTIWAGGSVNIGRGAIITAPVVPEPGTVVILALGGAMIVIRRKRRQAVRQ